MLWICQLLIPLARLPSLRDPPLHDPPPPPLYNPPLYDDFPSIRIVEYDLYPRQSTSSFASKASIYAIVVTNTG
jgi:hypothetical protein